MAGTSDHVRRRVLVGPVTAVEEDTTTVFIIVGAALVSAMVAG